MIKITIEIDSKNQKVYNDLINSLTPHVTLAKESDSASTYSSVRGSFNPKK